MKFSWALGLELLKRGARPKDSHAFLRQPFESAGAIPWSVTFCPWRSLFAICVRLSSRSVRPQECGLSVYAVLPDRHLCYSLIGHGYAPGVRPGCPDSLMVGIPLLATSWLQQIANARSQPSGFAHRNFRVGQPGWPSRSARSAVNLRELNDELRAAGCRAGRVSTGAGNRRTQVRTEQRLHTQLGRLESAGPDYSRHRRAPGTFWIPSPVVIRSLEDNPADSTGCVCLYDTWKRKKLVTCVGVQQRVALAMELAMTGTGPISAST